MQHKGTNQGCPLMVLELPVAEFPWPNSALELPVAALPLPVMRLEFPLCRRRSTTSFTSADGMSLFSILQESPQGMWGVQFAITHG